MIRSELADPADLAAWAETRLPRLIDDTCAATVDRIPFCRDHQVVPADELRGSVEHGSVECAAEVLHYHPNTVRYRLRRRQELTGRSLSDPHGVAEPATAAYALSLNPVSAPWQLPQAPALHGRQRPGPQRVAGRGRVPAPSGSTVRPSEAGGRR
jgi:hypothetical protein